jgi:URI fold toxin 2
MSEQVDLGNLYVGWDRYFARIIIEGIEGRALALKLEDTYIKTIEKTLAKGQEATGKRENLNKNLTKLYFY